MWQFEPTARLKDFDRVPGLRQAWTDMINDSYKANLYGKPGDNTLSALEELRQRGASEHDLRVYNPSVKAIPANSTAENVTWSALPTSFDEQFASIKEKYVYLDNRQPFPPAPQIVTRIQDEYCEWVVFRNAANKITEVIFTSEPPEYYDFLFEHAKELLVKLYQEICGVPAIKLEDLTDAQGNYDWWNEYNNKYAVHMQQPNNTLGAQVNIVSRAGILRKKDSGSPITDALGLIRCAGYGDPSRQSDPSIGHAINSLARQNKFITIEDPVGLYMSKVDWSGWETPDGADASAYWTVLRGSQDADPNKSYIVRATFSVPADKSYTVSDITIAGEKIEYGAQIAGKVNVRVAVMASPAQSTLPAPAAIVCTRSTSAALESNNLAFESTEPAAEISWLEPESNKIGLKSFAAFAKGSTKSFHFTRSF